jgi:23S rRNA (cytosine1962-C5)-methyltransferase
LDTENGQYVRYLLGGPGQDPLKVKEHGDFYFADRDSIHSNGLFLDARPARQWIKKNASSRRVYNMFAHTGSLGVAAKLGGAREVVHIDKNRELVDKIRLNYEFNNLVPDPRGLVIGDIYYHLPRAIKWKQKFDAIILDPPPRVPVPPHAPKHRPIGQDFATLIATCCKILEKDGWLLCIYHDFRKSHDTFDQEIIKASDGSLAPIWRGQADEDFRETDPERKTRMTSFAKVED